MRAQLPFFWLGCTIVGAFALLNVVFWPLSVQLDHSKPMSLALQMFLVGLVAAELILLSLLLAARNARTEHLIRFLIATGILFGIWMAGATLTAFWDERFVGKDVGQLVELMSINVEFAGMIVLGAALPVSWMRQIMGIQLILPGGAVEEKRGPILEDLLLEFIIYGALGTAFAVVTCVRHVVWWQPAEDAMTFLAVAFFGGCLASIPICLTALLTLWKPGGWSGLGMVGGAWAALTLFVLFVVFVVIRMNEAMYSGGHIDLDLATKLAAIVATSAGCFLAVAGVMKLTQANGVRLSLLSPRNQVMETVR